MCRKIILNLAMSLDGYIVDEESRFDWIKGDGNLELNTKNQFDFSDFLQNVDTIVMGRKSYEDCGIDDFNIGDKKNFIVATRKKRSPLENVEFISDNITEKVMNLKNIHGKDIWIFGGSLLADSFIKKDLIDEFIVGIVPIILGKGTPLFLQNNPRITLKMQSYSIKEGLIILKYSKRETKENHGS